MNITTCIKACTPLGFFGTGKIRTHGNIKKANGGFVKSELQNINSFSTTIKQTLTPDQASKTVMKHKSRPSVRHIVYIVHTSYYEVFKIATNTMLKIFSFQGDSRQG